MNSDEPTYVARTRLPISQKAGQSPATLCFPGSRTDASPRKDGDDDEEEEEKEEELEEEEE